MSCGRGSGCGTLLERVKQPYSAPNAGVGAGLMGCVTQETGSATHRTPKLPSNLEQVPPPPPSPNNFSYLAKNRYQLMINKFERFVCCLFGGFTRWLVYCKLTHIYRWVVTSLQQVWGSILRPRHFRTPAARRWRRAHFCGESAASAILWETAAAAAAAAAARQGRRARWYSATFLLLFLSLFSLLQFFLFPPQKCRRDKIYHHREKHTLQ